MVPNEFNASVITNKIEIHLHSLSFGMTTTNIWIRLKNNELLLGHDIVHIFAVVSDHIWALNEDDEKYGMSLSTYVYYHDYMFEGKGGVHS